MLILQAIILGIIQGLTEFMPLSSSAHLIIVPWLFGWNDPALTSLSFDVALHFGTLLAVLVFFATDWLSMGAAAVASIRERKIGLDPERRFVWLLVIATIPGVIVGAAAESKIEALFHEPGHPISISAMVVMAAIIALMGLALFLADQKARHDRGLYSISLKDAIIIGCAQALAIFPGVSRSGSTITAGLALGLDRGSATRYSFLLSAPIVAGAGFISLLKLIGQIKSGLYVPAELVLFPIGFISAALSGFLCIKYLLRYLQHHSMGIFVYYRWALAALVIAIAVSRG